MQTTVIDLIARMNWNHKVLRKRAGWVRLMSIMTTRCLVLRELLSWRLAHFLLVMCLATAVVSGLGRQVPGQPPPTPFVYEKKTYQMDHYSVLFGSATPLGAGRLKLFDTYVKSTPEGRARTGSMVPASVWAGMAIEEQTSFLAITAALASLTDENGVGLLSWVQSLEQIHGSLSPASKAKYKNNEAFRIYVKLTSGAVTHLHTGKGRFTGACSKLTFGYGVDGSEHKDFCNLPRQFQLDRKTRYLPNLQFNLTAQSQCADIDLDFDLVRHLSRDNSNILGHGGDHLPAFIGQYCDPGFR